MVKKYNKRGQLTIFIIFAIMLAVIIILLFLMRGEEQIEVRHENPRTFIQSCVRDSVENSVGIVLDNGGRINPSQYINYSGEMYNYLCYQGDYYLSCYNTHPMLNMIVEREIRENTKDQVQGCFDKMKNEFEARGFSVEGGATTYDIEIVPGSVDVKLNKRVDLRNNEGSSSIEDFSFQIVSPLYELLRVSRDIVNSESEFCNVEYVGYMVLYPQFDIRRTDYSDSKIYWVRDRKSEDEFRFAVRSCAFAPGI